MKSLSHILTVFRREFAAYFNSSIAYIFIIVFILLNGGLYMTQFFVIGLADMRPFFMLLPYVLCVFLPAVTMRLWADERRGNTLELLLTFPMATHELVIGKFLASFVFYAAALLGTLTIPVMLKFLGMPDLGAIAGGYIGSLLLGGFFLAVGIFVSGLCRDQIVAFILAMIIAFGLYLTGTEFLASSIDSWLPGLGTFLRRYIGAAGHFESFARGVVDNRDVMYFAAGTLIFLVLNGFWLEGRMKAGAKKIFTAAVVVCAGIFLLGNWFFSGISMGRFDLSEGKMYTISGASKKILTELKAPVIAKFYISPADKMPTGMKTVEQDVVDKLDELRVASGGKFQYKIFRMEAANVVEAEKKEGEESLEKQLQKKGIQPFQVRAVESDEVAVRLVYSSIALAYKEKPEEVISRIVPDNMKELEYLIMSRVYRMTLDASPKIAIVAPFEEKTVNPELAALLAQLGGKSPEAYKDDAYEIVQMALEYEGYEVSRILLTEDQQIPAGIKTLIILEPESLNERQRYEINKFVRNGGSLMAAVQNYTYDYQTNGRELSIKTKRENPDINSLLQAWGFEVDENILVDQQSDVINLSGATKVGPFDVAVPVQVPIQILINETGMNHDVSITSRLSPMFYLWGTALKIDDAKVAAQGLKVQKLLFSSKDSWTVPFQEGALLPQQLNLKPESRKGPFPLALMAQGQFADAFEGKQMPDWPAKPEGEPRVFKRDKNPAGPAPGRLILIGASTFFQKQLIHGGGHLHFLMNCVDILTMGEALITIRSKQPVDRTVGRISAPAKVAWRLFVMFLVPALLTAGGTMRLLLRRQAKQNYMKELAASK